MLVRRFARRTMSSVPATFHALEHGNWGKESTVGAYDQWFGPLTRQCTPDLLSAVSAGPARTILDVATGPGYLAEAARKEGADVTAIDFSANMISCARARVADPSVKFLEADATRMPFEDQCFDGIICNFGVLHLTSPEDFFAEAMRVLKPGGQLAFTVWAALPAAEAMDVLTRVVGEHGNPHVELPQGPPFFRFADAATCKQVLQSAGFLNVLTREVPMLWEVSKPEDLYAAFLEGTGRTQALLRGQTSEQSAAIQKALASEAVRRQTTPGGPAIFKMPCALTAASKPE